MSVGSSAVCVTDSTVDSEHCDSTVDRMDSDGSCKWSVEGLTMSHRGPDLIVDSSYAGYSTG